MLNRNMLLRTVTAVRILVLALCAWHSAHAQGGPINLSAGAVPGEVVVEVKNPSDACGIGAIFSGDPVGNQRSHKTDAFSELDKGETATFKHRFERDGVYAILVGGVEIAGLFKPTRPCDLRLVATVWVSGGTTTVGTITRATGSDSVQLRSLFVGQSGGPAVDAQDLLLLANPRTVKFVQTLAGRREVANGADLAKLGIKMCVPAFAMPPPGITDAERDEAAHRLGQERIQALLGISNVRTDRHECLSSSTGRSGNPLLYLKSDEPDFILVQRLALPILRPLGHKNLANVYTIVETLEPARLAAAIQSQQEAKERELRARADELRAAADRITLLDKLARSNPKEVVGSIEIGPPPTGVQVNFCTLRYEGEAAHAIMGYIERGLATQSRQLREAVALASAQASARGLGNLTRTIRHFEDAEAIYRMTQTQPGACHIYVDFPENLQRVLNAARSTGKGVTLNALMWVNGLHETWAKSQGHASYGQFLQAQEMRVDLSTYTLLAAHGVTEKRLLDEAVTEMKTRGYGSGDQVSEVILYLRDRAEAATRSGMTAVQVRDARRRDQQLEEQARARAERLERERIAKEFPYVAILSCGNPSHRDIRACFVGRGLGLGTEIRLRNGESLQLYPFNEIHTAGTERRDGLHIDLRSTFDLRAQNAGAHVILGLKVIERVTNRVVYEDKVTQFGVVRARN